MRTMSETEKLSSTGRTPALTPTQVEEMLTFYFSDARPSVPEVAERFPQVAKSGPHEGVARPMSKATVRKYLKACGLVLPRGRANAAHLPRVAPASVRTLVNRIPTVMLIGSGRVELMSRLLGRGESIASCVTKFGVSKERVRKIRDEVLSSAPTSTVEEAEAEASEAIETLGNEFIMDLEAAKATPEAEANILDGLDEALEASEEASEDTTEA